MLEFKHLNNQCVIEGTIINSIRQKYEKSSSEQIVYFVIASSRKDYPLTYNKEDNNYFYCYASERLMSGTFLDMIRKNYKTYDNVKIRGILDNMPFKNSSSKEVNKRAKHCYLSSICIIDIKICQEKPQATNNEIAIINSIRKTFGTNINVEIKEDAFNKDYFGLDIEDMPDY